MKDTENNPLDFLRMNYNNLHESIWNNHRVAWVVTSIFIPVLFAMLGYLVKEYDYISKTQALMGFLVVESLLIIWLLIMLSFKRYNNVRLKRLKEIENLFNKKVFNQFYLFTMDLDIKESRPGKIEDKLRNAFKENNISLSGKATLREFSKQNIWKIEDGRMSYIIKEIDNQLKVYDLDFAQYNLDYKPKPIQFVLLPWIKLRFSFMNIYYWLAAIYTALNIGFLVVKFIY